MPAALAYPKVREALQELGESAVFLLGTAEAKERLKAEDLSDAEALALALDVGELAVLLATGR